jgi:multicomponent Na+:H+ antiporter subunit F
MNILPFLLDILSGILVISLLICFIRLYLGPSVPDRTVAFDAIAVHAVGLLALVAIRTDAPSLLDVAVVTAVLGFLGTTMLAAYLERAHALRWYQREPAPNDSDKPNPSSTVGN